MARAAARAMWGATALCAAASLLACQRADDEPRRIRVERFRPAGEGGVFLNEVLTVHLSAPIDPASVHRGSARVVDSSGRAVDGRFEVDAERLRFHPRAPVTVDLDDGTFAPGGVYRLELAGFPRPDGIRGREGEPLAGAWSASFTIATDSPGQPLFEDPTLWRSHPLTLAATELETTAPIELRCDEPLDPRTVRGEAFQLRRFESAENGAARLTRIDLRAELTANGRDGALVSLFPLDGEGQRRALEPGEHHFGLDPAQAPPLDFGGNPVGVLWGSVPGGLAPLTVVDRRVEGSARRHVFDFLDAGRRSPEAPVGVDGTAWWNDGGVVSVRLPAASGDGSDGPVLVADGALPGSIAATSLRLPRGRSASLPADGAVVLRAQGRMELSGRLERRGATGGPSWDGEGGHEDWIASLDEAGGAGTLPQIDFGEFESLSAWLDAVEVGDKPWTVIVAGGDLVIDGELLVDGPLVLVAGGWVRVSGRVSASEVWKSDLGFGERLRRRPRLLPLDLDPPSENPLREEQSWTVLSAPFKPPEEPVRWASARYRSDPGSGSIRVRFLGERPLPEGGFERIGPVDDLVLLEDSPAVRILVELDLGPGRPGQPWTPPRLDSVELAWMPDP